MIFANAASMMREEQPKVNKCCFPLHRKMCLQTWAYTKITTNLFALTAILLLVFSGNDLMIEESMYPLFGAIIIIIIIDIGFQIASIVGVHQKKYIVLRIFYHYEILALLADFIITPVILYSTNTKESSRATKTVIILIIGLFYILVDVCIIARVKREITKIHHKYEVSSLHE